MNRPKPLVLIILDGWGYRADGYQTVLTECAKMSVRITGSPRDGLMTFQASCRH